MGRGSGQPRVCGRRFRHPQTLFDTRKISKLSFCINSCWILNGNWRSYHSKDNLIIYFISIWIQFNLYRRSVKELHNLRVSTVTFYSYSNQSRHVQLLKYKTNHFWILSRPFIIQMQIINVYFMKIIFLFEFVIESLWLKVWSMLPSMLSIEIKNV